jgi:hypothetical protein
MTKGFDNLLMTILKIKAQVDQQAPHPSCRLEGNRVSLKKLGRAFLNELASELGPNQAFVNGNYPNAIAGVPIVENERVPNSELWLIDCDEHRLQVLQINFYLESRLLD